jgi:hypothetical protein
MNPLTPTPGGVSQPIRTPAKVLLEFLSYGNPIYLLSAAFMLLGCLLLTNDLSFTRVSLAQVSSLLGTIFLYQLCLFASGALLLLKRGVVRDGSILLTLDAIFLCDITFALSNYITTSPSAGLGLGLLLAGLGVGRVAWISSRLGLPVDLSRLFGVAMLLVLIPLVPAVLKWTGPRGNPSPMIFYSLWWLVSFAGAWLLLTVSSNGKSQDRLHRFASRLQLSTLWIAWMSLAAHLGALHWVYDVRFSAPMVSPVLLVIAVLAWRMNRSHILHWSEARMVQTLSIVAALVASGRPAGQLTSHLTLMGQSMSITPMMLAVVAAFLIFVFLIVQRHQLSLLCLGAMVGLWKVAGPTAEQVQAFVRNTVEQIWTALRNATPDTAAGWGVWSVVIAFGLLAVGLIFSFRKPSETEPPAEPLEPAIPTEP